MVAVSFTGLSRHRLSSSGMPQQWTRRTLLGTLATSAGFAKSRMRAGCQTRCYGSPIRDKQKLLAVLEHLAAAGYEGFETNFASM